MLIFTYVVTKILSLSSNKEEGIPIPQQWYQWLLAIFSIHLLVYLDSYTVNDTTIILKLKSCLQLNVSNIWYRGWKIHYYFVKSTNAKLLHFFYQTRMSNSSWPLTKQLQYCYHTQIFSNHNISNNNDKAIWHYHEKEKRTWLLPNLLEEKKLKVSQIHQHVFNDCLITVQRYNGGFAEYMTCAANNNFRLLLLLVSSFTHFQSMGIGM